MTPGPSTPVTWKASSNDSVLTVDQQGRVSAVGLGEATITVTDKNDASLTSTSTVKVREVSEEAGIELSASDVSAVVNHISRTAKIPVLTGFPFGHITNKTTFPLGAHAKVRSTGNGGYSVTFSGYPTLNPSALTLNNLLPPPIPTYDSTIYRDSITEEVTE